MVLKYPQGAILTREKLIAELTDGRQLVGQLISNRFGVEWTIKRVVSRPSIELAIPPGFRYLYSTTASFGGEDLGWSDVYLRGDEARWHAAASGCRMTEVLERQGFTIRKTRLGESGERLYRVFQTAGDGYQLAIAEVLALDRLCPMLDCSHSGRATVDTSGRARRV